MIRVSSRWWTAVLGTAGVLAILIYLICVFLQPWKKYEIEYSVGPRAVDSLKMLIVVSNNGNHRAGTDYPGDPYPNDDLTYWPYTLKELTPRGRDQMYNLGVKVRSLYSGFIPVTLYPDDIHATSTYMDRVLMSGEAFLAGLYPPRGFQVWDTGLAWQPSAIYSDSPDRSLDVTFGKCPLYDQELKESMGIVYEKYESNFTDLSDYLTNVTGVNFTSPIQLIHIQQKAFSEKYEEYDLPDWLEEIYDKLRCLVSEIYMAIFAGTQTITRLIAGELVEQMLDVMIQKVNGSLTPDRKIFYYSGHAASITALQRVLGVPQGSMVGMIRPGSGLILELHRSNLSEEYYVQVVYLDGSSLGEEPLMFNMTGCGFNCCFVNILENARPYTGVNFTQECHANSTSETDSTTNIPLKNLFQNK